MEALNNTIYPTGVVWMPTSERYLQHYITIVEGMDKTERGNMLDLGCGSGILSFLFAKRHKKWKVYSIDNNPAAVSTTNINAAKLNLPNVEATVFDILQQ